MRSLHVALGTGGGRASSYCGEGSTWTVCGAPLEPGDVDAWCGSGSTSCACCVPLGSGSGKAACGKGDADGCKTLYVNRTSRATMSANSVRKVSRSMEAQGPIKGKSKGCGIKKLWTTLIHVEGMPAKLCVLEVCSTPRSCGTCVFHTSIWKTSKKRLFVTRSADATRQLR